MIPAHLKGRDFLRVNDWEPDELLLVLEHAGACRTGSSKGAASG